jgi:hypothetical protein
VALGVHPADLTLVGAALETAFLALQETDLETEFLRAKDILKSYGDV